MLDSMELGSFALYGSKNSALVMRSTSNDEIITKIFLLSILLKAKSILFTV